MEMAPAEVEVISPEPELNPVNIPALASPALEPPVIVQSPLVLQTILPPTSETMYAGAPSAARLPCRVSVVGNGAVAPMEIASPTGMLLLLMMRAGDVVLLPPVKEIGPAPSMVMRPPRAAISAKAPVAVGSPPVI